MKARVCVIGGATWDVLFTTSQADLVTPAGRAEQPVLAFPYGGKVDARHVVYGYGGGAANVAVSLASLGVRPQIVTRVGSDWRGQEVTKNLHRAGCDLELVQRDRSETTALAFIVTAGGAHDHVAFVARGASAGLVLPGRLPLSCSWGYVTALASPGWFAGLRPLFASADRRGQFVFWNPGAAQLAEASKVKSLLKHVTVLDVNDDEARLLAGKLRLKGRRPPELARALHRLGPAGVLITAGAKGAYFYDGRKLHWRASCRVRPVNTTGAGDAFGAGWLAGYLGSGGSIREAMDWGMYNASSVIMQVGAQRGILDQRTLAVFKRRYG